MNNGSDFFLDFKSSVIYSILAHSEHSLNPENATRWDHITPYAVHPIWCAMTLLTETALPKELRYIGYQVLLWHDLLEDTDLPLPNSTSKEVRNLVEEMTFTSFYEEKQQLWNRSKEAKLLKLYDKVSNLLDGVWMSNELWKDYLMHTLKLSEFVNQEYGELNIIKIARAVCVERS
jgi:hypothetical protein